MVVFNSWLCVVPKHVSLSFCQSNCIESWLKSTSKSEIKFVRDYVAWRLPNSYRLHRYSAINEGTKAGEGFANIKPTKVDGLFSKCARSACVYTETNKAERTWMDINGYWLEVFHKELFIDAKGAYLCIKKTWYSRIFLIIIGVVEKMFAHFVLNRNIRLKRELLNTKSASRMVLDQNILFLDN